MSSLKDKRSLKTEAAAVAVAGPAEVVVGRLAGVCEDGAPLVDFAGNPADMPIRALATARYGGVACGTSVALMFVDGDRARPLAIGVVSLPEPEPTSALEDRLTLTAAREIVLQCGRASLVLTRAGKVLVRGAYVSLRSSGVQRITGASVQIN
jgi:hypothetical protein